MSRRDQWLSPPRPAVAQYFTFADALRAFAGRDGYAPQSGDHITFHLAMPESWSRKKRDQLLGEPHTQTPDLDNLAKAFYDSLLGSDAFIWLVTLEKRWAIAGRIDVRRGK